ncbi:flagellar cap protein FliD N-terminal domain-containing protein, partial [uncultured Helicobacter sp.]|uniref:flagellar cap protein FliD N-terminal domain-containing protein n=1 Tax=uncultured Helicobacter sp. TaxID=175537 RepID=UPI002711D4A8
MSSVSSTSSLGNTSLRGFGGMASGIDRDAIIEKMTLGTTTKISNRKQDITKLQWKQEAYRNLSDKIIDISDKYASYSSTSNLKDPSAFAK